MGIKTFLFWKTYWGDTMNSSLMRKPFIELFTAIDRDRITSWLIYYNKIFCTKLFSIDVHWNSSVKLTKVLVKCLNASSLKSVLPCLRTTCVNTRALIRRAVKRAGSSKKVWCSRLGSTKTRRFQITYTLELRFLKNLHETPTWIGEFFAEFLSYFFVKKYLLVGASAMLWAVQWVDQWVDQWEMYVCHTNQIGSTIKHQSNFLL